MRITILGKYNNYKNRKCRYYTNVYNYRTHSTNYISREGINFNPNDGVDTKLTWNFLAGETIFEPDYLLVDTGSGSTYGETIVSRWYVIDSTYTREGQYVLTLHRDTPADYLNTIINHSYGNVFRAIPGGTFNTSFTNIVDIPYLANQENVLVNKIKKSETLLKDKTKTAWLVGYVARDAFQIEAQAKESKYINGYVNHYGEFTLTMVGQETKTVGGVTYNYVIWNYLGYNGKPVTVYSGVLPPNDNAGIDHEQIGAYFKKDYKLTQPTSLLYWPNTYIIDTDIKTGNISMNIDYSDVFHCKDQPYDIFCMPYSTGNGGKRIKIIRGGNTTIIDSAVTLTMAQTMIKELTANKVYDIQLLPYCPFENEVTVTEDSTYININVNSVASPVTYIYDNSVASGTMMWVQNSNSHFTIASWFGINLLPNQNKIIEYKTSAQCDLYRICSPNMASAMDFSVVNNNGGCMGFNIDMTLKPFTPFIAVSPQYNNNSLYGQDFNDYRGLILRGDFSIPNMSDAWRNYEYNNKNYAAQFSRQIYNQERMNQLELLDARLNSIASAIGTGVQTGAMASYAGYSEYAGIAGAAMAGASLVAGAADEGILKQKQQLAIANAYADRSMSLGNIQALSETINNIGAFDKLNKLFPVLEKYSCTDFERNSFKTFIYMNSVSVGVEDTFENWITLNSSMDNKVFFQGHIIINEDIEVDAHLLDAINKELEQGIYF